MSLRSFTFFVRNDETREIATFIGDGSGLEAAWKDAVKGIKSPFNPSSSGGANSYTHVVLPLNVRLADGRRVARKLEDFEGGRPWSDEDAPPAPPPWATYKK